MSHDWDDPITIPLDDVSKTEVYVIIQLLQPRELLSESFRVIEEVKIKVQTKKILKEIKMFVSLIKLQNFILVFSLGNVIWGQVFLNTTKDSRLGIEILSPTLLLNFSPIP